MRVGDRDDNVEHMWEQVKWAMFESERSFWLSENGGRNPECGGGTMK